MYKVSITLRHGGKYESVVKSFLRAVLIVESFLSEAIGYQIEMIDDAKGGEDNSGCEMDQTCNRFTGQQKNQTNTQTSAG